MDFLGNFIRVEFLDFLKLLFFSLWILFIIIILLNILIKNVQFLLVLVFLIINLFFFILFNLLKLIFIKINFREFFLLYTWFRPFFYLFFLFFSWVGFNWLGLKYNLAWFINVIKNFHEVNDLNFNFFIKLSNHLILEDGFQWFFSNEFGVFLCHSFLIIWVFSLWLFWAKFGEYFLESVYYFYLWWLGLLVIYSVKFIILIIIVSVFYCNSLSLLRLINYF